MATEMKRLCVQRALKHLTDLYAVENQRLAGINTVTFRCGERKS
jgi:hypothetical protein